MNIRPLSLLFVLSTFQLAGCSTFSPVYSERQSTLISAAYDAVDNLVNRQPRAPLIVSGAGQRVIVATIVNLNNLDRSSAFGRLLSEQMASRLVQLGLTVTELKLRGNLYVSQSQGELLLSRELRDISASQSADAVLVGTYVDAGNSIYVTVKLVRPSDSTVSSAYNFAIEKSGNISALLADSK